MARRIGVEIFGDSRSVERAFRRAGAAGILFNKRMSKTQRAVRVTGRVGVASIAGLAGVVGVAIKKAASFEQSLNMLQSVSQANQKQMRSLSALAVKLGADMTLPATSAADAATVMTELAKGGLSVKQVMGAAKGTLQLAAAANLDNAEAATITARALNAFGLSGNQAAKVADILANAANASTGDVSDFALGLQQSAAAAHSMGLSVNENVAALMAMADAGIVGSDAGTSVKTMLARLVPSTEKARKLMTKLGIDIFDAQGNFIGIRGAIKEYQRALSMLSQEEREAAINTLFGSDAKRAANVIIMRGLPAFDKYLALTRRQGTAASVAGARMKGLAGAIEGLKSILETLAITFGMGFLQGATMGVAKLNEKLSDPKVQAALQRVGTLVGTKLRLALIAVGQWMAANWPNIKAGFRIAARLIRLMAAGVVLLKDAFVAAAPIIAAIIRFAILKPLAIALKVLSGILEIASHLPKKLGGGKFQSAKEFVNSTRETLGDADSYLSGVGKPKTKRVTPTRHRVGHGDGQRPVPGGSGNVILNIDGREVGRAVMPHLQRQARSGAASPRGRHGGHNVALS